MFIPDTNVWAALTIGQHEHHGAASEWFDTVETPQTVHFCRVTQQGLMRLLTRHAILATYGLAPLTNAQAWGAFEDLQHDDRVGPLLDEPASVEQVWQRLSSRSSASPQLWTDSYLAAFAITAGATFVTIDRAFTQFPALDLQLIE